MNFIYKSPSNTFQIHVLYRTYYIRVYANPPTKQAFNPFMPVGPNFADISLTKASSRRYLKESCSSELYLQLPFKYFLNLSFIPKLILKVWQVQMTLHEWISWHDKS